MKGLQHYTAQPKSLSLPTTMRTIQQEALDCMLGVADSIDCLKAIIYQKLEPTSSGSIGGLEMILREFLH